MSGISSVGSPFIPLTTGTSTPSVTNTSTQGSSSPSVSFFQDSLGVPLAGNNLGLPMGGAPGDSEALLALIALKLRQTIGTTNNNAVQTRANEYTQQLEQAQSIIAEIVNASNDLTAQQMDYQTTQTALTNAKSRLQVLYTPLTGDGNQQNLQAVTQDPNGSQGTYGQYLAAFNNFQSKSGAYSTINDQVSQDQTAYNTALAKASTSDPNAYYLSVYQARANQLTSLQNKRSQLAAMNPPQQLSAADQATLNKLSAPATTSGSVAEAANQFQALQNDVSNTLTTLQTDQGKQAVARQDLLTAQTAIIPYLDYNGGTSFTDKYPQSGNPVTYTFFSDALNGVTPKSSGIISSSLDLINAVIKNKNDLTKHMTDVGKNITNDQNIISNFNTQLILAFSQGVASVLSQHNTDQTTSGNAAHANDAILRNRLDSNNDNIGDLNESQEILSKLEDLRRQVVALLENPAGQAAVQIASDLTNTLLALNDLIDQPPVMPSTSDVFQNTSSQSSSTRMRIPV